MKRTSFNVLLVIIFFNLITVQSQVLATSELKSIDSLVRFHLGADTPGGAFAILKNGKTIYQKTRGMANMETKTFISDSTVFNIASVSKQFTTFLALQLEEDGKLSFEDDIRKYLPELKGLPQKITIKQLTNHTHGLPNVDELAQLQRKVRMSYWQVENMLLNISHGNFDPNSSYEYNNTGYVLLSVIIERIGEKPFQQQLEEMLFTPLHMNDTKAIGDEKEIIYGKSNSYRMGNMGYHNVPVQYATIGSSGIYSSLRDLILWAKNYQNTTIGKAAFFQRMRTPTVLAGGKTVEYGLGLQFENYKGIDIVFHGGGTEGYRSYLLHVPKDNLSFIFLANDGSVSGLDITYGSLEILLKNQMVNNKRTIAITGVEEIERFEGTYEINPGNYFTTIAKKDGLYYQPYGSKDAIKMERLEENIFAYPFVGHSTMTFHHKKVDLRIADFTYYAKRVVLDPPNSKDLDLEAFTGIYKNDAHNLFYELQIEDGHLIAKYNTDYDILLRPLNNTSFYASAAFFSKIDFVYDSKNEITGFKISGQKLSDIAFNKID